MSDLKEGSYYWVKWPRIDNNWTVALRSKDGYGKDCWLTAGSEEEIYDAMSDPSSPHFISSIVVGPEVLLPSPPHTMTTHLEADAVDIEACCKANNPAQTPRGVLVASIMLAFRDWDRIKINKVRIVEVPLGS